MTAATKKVMLFVVEGPSDETAFALLFDRVFSEHLVKFDVTHCDMTTARLLKPGDTNLSPMPTNGFVGKLSNTSSARRTSGPTSSRLCKLSIRMERLFPMIAWCNRKEVRLCTDTTKSRRLTGIRYAGATNERKKRFPSYAENAFLRTKRRMSPMPCTICRATWSTSYIIVLTKCLIEKRSCCLERFDDAIRMIWLVFKTFSARAIFPKKAIVPKRGGRFDKERVHLNAGQIFT